MIVVNWNVNWASAPWRTTEIRRRIHEQNPEIVCLTETHCGFLEGGHTITSRGDYGYGHHVSRRKVMLWSRQPWRLVDDLGDDEMPPGRFVTGVTETSLGEVTVIGVCVPWQNSRVANEDSTRRRQPWEDHVRYLERLRSVLAQAPVEWLVLMGDFNQTIEESGRRQSGAAAERAALLRRAIPAGVTMATEDFEHKGRKPIDHIALGTELRRGDIEPISNRFENRRLSDHAFGLAVVATERITEG